MHMRECQFFLWVLITKFTISCLLFWVLRGPPPFYPLSLVFLPFFLYSLKLLISLKRMCMLLLWVLCVFINNNNIQFISINQTIIWSSRTTITSISTSTSTTVTASTTNTSISIQPTNPPTDQLTKQFKEQSLIRAQSSSSLTKERQQKLLEIFAHLSSAFITRLFGNVWSTGMIDICYERNSTKICSKKVLFFFQTKLFNII